FATLYTLGESRRSDAEMSADTREVAFEAFINGAIGYCQAGDALLRIHQTASMPVPPIYNAYFIAAELALKAFLRYCGESTESLKKKWSHNLNGMYAVAIVKGLKPGEADLVDLQNVIGLL